MSNIQNTVGNSTEKLISNSFMECRYWAYILPKKVGGQPFDIIACKGNNTWFIDAKHLEANKASFAFDRIEPNQKTSMMYAHAYANIQNLGFAIVWDRTPDKIYFFPYLDYLEMEKNGEKSVKIDSLQDLKDLINENENNNI